MSDLFGTQLNIEGGLSSRQKIALTILIAIAIIAVIMWWYRNKPHDVVYLGPRDVGPGKMTDPDQRWLPLMTADQIAKKAGNNITCSFFLYVNPGSINRIPVNYDGSYKFSYLMTVGNTMGVTVNPATQTVTVDILQSSPASPRGDTIAAKKGLDSLRTLTVDKVYVAKWNQVTVCVEGRSIDVFLNGRLATSAVMDNVPVNMFSGLLLNESPDFDGQVCLFQVWNGRRTSQQILENYQANTDTRGKPRVPDPELTWTGSWERFLKASCESTGICGFPVLTNSLQYVEYQFA